MIINCKDCGWDINIDFLLGTRILNDGHESITWNCTKCFRTYEYRIKEPIDITEQINKELHK